MRIVNESKKSTIANYVILADTFFGRLKGLMFRRNLDIGEGLMLSPCNMIHTFGMRFNLDIIFLSKDNVVLYIIENFPPGKSSPMIHKANRVIELPVGTLKKSDTKLGDYLTFNHAL